MQRPSMPNLLIRLEGLTVFIAAIWAYAQYGSLGWMWFVLLLLAPDLAMLPYLIRKDWGAFSYNLVHNYVGPLVLLFAGIMGSVPTLVSLALIWFAHIGMDRIVGYGLKYTTDFKDTHIQRI